MTDSRTATGAVPPNDLGAEAAVIADVIARGGASLPAVLDVMRPGDCYSAANRAILAACEQLVHEGRTVDVVALVGHLRATDSLREAGGAQYVGEILGCTPVVSDVLSHARVVRDLADVRRAILSCQQLAAEGYQAARDPAGYLERVRALAGACECRQGSGLPWVEGADIIAPSDPIRWLCRDLALAPGRPALWVGYGYSGKSVSAQAMELALATGRPIWGHYAVREPRRVVHFDYEQGLEATRMRFRRLAFAMGITGEELHGQIRMISMPAMYLTDHGVEDRLCRELEGWHLATWDSLRAVCPGVDEIDSRIRMYLDILTRVSERVGCASQVIHHAGKGGKQKESREVPRGNSAIFDAVGTAYTLTAKEPGDPVIVKAIKTSADYAGVAEQSFALQIEDVADDDGVDLFAGLRVRWMTAEQADPPEDSSNRFSGILADVLAYIEREPGASKNMVEGEVRGRREDIRRAIDTLITRKQIAVSRRPGRGGGEAYHVA